MDYVKYVEIIKELKRQGKYAEAAEILMGCVEATEEEDRQNGWGVAPWYYEQLAIIYKKEGDKNKEIQILRRYAKQNKAPGFMPEKLKQRLNSLLKESS
jgi:hypothetical protein